MPARETVTASVIVKIIKAKNEFQFVYSGEYSTANGDLDFKGSELKDKSVAIEFSIDPDSAAGAKFLGGAQEAIWIALKSAVGADGCPKRSYSGGQFFGFSVDPSGQRLRVTDMNDDGETYRYALRFDVGGEIAVSDPDVGNGGGN